MTPLKAQAIQSALTGDFENAVLLNKQISESYPQDLDTLNRLAFAYESLGKAKEAKETYQRVLELDSLNPIALRGIKKLSQSSTPGLSKKNDGASNVLGSIFLEETGKTKIVELINTADKKISSSLRMGEAVTLSIKRLKIFLLDSNKSYIGMLPDDIGKRLIRLINGNYKYDAYIKSVSETHITVFVREVKRSARFKNQPSFLPQEKKRLLLTRRGKQ